MDLIKIRRYLHQFPEVSGYEKETSKFIRDQLSSLQKCDHFQVADTGVLAVFEGKEEGIATLLRADIDALPIKENNNIPYISRREGVSHLCGHDGHTSILLGVAKYLNDYPIKKGRCILLFQPSEENGMGAKSVLADELFSSFSYEYAFALHNIPGYAKGTVLLKEGAFSSAVESFLIQIKGTSSHASAPWTGRSPNVLVQDLLAYCLQSQQSKDGHYPSSFITPIYLQVGDKAFGTSPSDAVFAGTLRSFNEESFQRFKNEFLEVLKVMSTQHDLKVEIEWTERFVSNENHPVAVSLVNMAAIEVGLKTLNLLKPFKWGEDFGLLNATAKGCMFGVGAGENSPDLHEPNYDFPDEIIAPCVKIFNHIINQLHR